MATETIPRVSDTERRRRWRLVLGGAADEFAEHEGPGGSSDESRGPGDPGGREPSLAGDDLRIDAALAALYDLPAEGERRRGAGPRGGGLGRSRPGVVRWLGDIRRYFPTPIVRVMQRDAIDRLDMKELLLEPELLQTVEADLHLVTLLVELNRVLPSGRARRGPPGGFGR